MIYLYSCAYSILTASPDFSHGFLVFGFELQEVEILRFKCCISQNLGFEQKLVQLVPDFAQLDKDERWVAWLNEYDPMLNGPRRVIAKDAYEKGDADTVAHYVNLWKQSIAEPEVDPRAGRQAELEKQVAPNRSANSVDTKKVGKEAKIYSEREINGAWTKIRNLNTKGQFDEAAKLEAEITAAYLEGRIRQ